MPWKRGQSGNPATRFKPGVSGNPRGRPKGPTIATRLRDLLEKTSLDGDGDGDGEGTGKPLAEQVAEVIVKRALEGDYACIRILLDRTEGRVPDRQEVELRGLSDSELIARITYRDEAG